MVQGLLSTHKALDRTSITAIKEKEKLESLGGLRYNIVVRSLPSIRETLGSMPGTEMDISQQNSLKSINWGLQLHLLKEILFTRYSNNQSFPISRTSSDGYTIVFIF